MAEDVGESKSTRKNKKRRSKKPNEGFEITSEIEELSTVNVDDAVVMTIDPIAELKKQLDEAKAVKDHKKAQKLREQLWILQDTVSQGKPGPGAPVVDSALIPITTESVQSISTVESVQSVSPDTHTQSAMTVDNPNLKTLQKLEKKMKSIQELKAKRDKGIKLEANQRLKISKEEELKQEIELIKNILTEDL